MAQLVDHKRRVLQLAPGQRTHRTKSDRQQWKFISRDRLFRRQNDRKKQQKRRTFNFRSTRRNFDAASNERDERKELHLTH